MVWFWFFFSYSFIGYLLEVLFAWVTGRDRDRGCLLFLPLCPVYGLGACLVLLLRPLAGGSRAGLILLGAVVCTLAEYGASLWYEKALGLRFWDYRGLPGSLRGRVCLPFSLAWGALSLGLGEGIHPLLSPLLTRIPLPVGLGALACVCADLCLRNTLLGRGAGWEGVRAYRKSLFSGPAVLKREGLRRNQRVPDGTH